MSKNDTSSLARVMGNTNVATAELNRSSEQKSQDQSLAENLFSQTGAKLPPPGQLKQQEQSEEESLAEELFSETGAKLPSKEQLNALRIKELSNKVNPIDQEEIFNQKIEAEKEEVEQLIATFIQMAQAKQIPKTQVPEILDARVVNPGERGNLFQGLLAPVKNFIETYKPQNWATAMKTKEAKGPQGPGAKTKKIHRDFDNPENNTDHMGA